VPVIVLNGRLSEKSAKGYRKISFFMKEVFPFVKFFGMQSNIDAERLRKIGCEEEKVSVLGNFKFDMDMPGKIPSWARVLKAPVIVAGSTHRGEEEIVISAYSENLQRFPELKLIIAPRHPERFKEVEDILKAKGISFLKRSELGSQNQIPANFLHGVILLDSIGELSSVYGLADIAIIGKSFIGFGGQNPLEPAYWGKPVLCGPHMENFPFIREFYDEGAAFEIEASDLGKKIGELLDEPDRGRASGEKAKALFMKNSGSVGKSMKIVGDFIGPA
jgi:3-deoxy-D-manno-octulosonic-acid transferase